MTAEHATDDDALSRQLVRGSLHLLFREAHLQAIAPQPLHDGLVFGIVEEGHHAAGYHLAHALHFLQVLQRGIGKCVHGLEMAGQQSRRCLAHETDAQGEDHSFEGHIHGCLDAVDDFLGRLRARTVAVNLLHVDVVEVGHVVHESMTEVVVDGFRPQRVDVHGAARYEMLYAAFDLRRTAGVVGTIPSCLALVAHKGRSALGTALHELHRLRNDGPLVQVYPHNLGDNLAAFLHIHVVAYVKVERADEGFVVQRRAFHGRSGQLHGVHVGDGCHGTGAAHLVGHLIETGAGAFGLELIGDGPARTLGREAQRTLLPQRVHLEHDAVGGHGQVLPLAVPVADIVEDVL